MIAFIAPVRILLPGSNGDATLSGLVASACLQVVSKSQWPNAMSELFRPWESIVPLLGNVILEWSKLPHKTLHHEREVKLTDLPQTNCAAMRIDRAGSCKTSAPENGRTAAGRVEDFCGAQARRYVWGGVIRYRCCQLRQSSW